MKEPCTRSQSGKVRGAVFSGEALSGGSANWISDLDPARGNAHQRISAEMEIHAVRNLGLFIVRQAPRFHEPAGHQK